MWSLFTGSFWNIKNSEGKQQIPHRNNLGDIKLERRQNQVRIKSAWLIPYQQRKMYLVLLLYSLLLMVNIKFIHYISLFHNGEASSLVPSLATVELMALNWKAESLNLHWKQSTEIVTQRYKREKYPQGQRNCIWKSPVIFFSKKQSRSWCHFSFSSLF